MSARKDRRIEMRVDADSEDRIVRAATIRRQSVSSFVLQAAVQEAETVLARTDRFLMSADQFDRLIDSLDVPDAAPRLQAAAANERRFRRG